jgi:hypothetical protein
MTVARSHRVALCCLGSSTAGATITAMARSGKLLRALCTGRASPQRPRVWRFTVPRCESGASDVVKIDQTQRIAAIDEEPTHGGECGRDPLSGKHAGFGMSAIEGADPDREREVERWFAG